jgi:hypothetical protein
MKPQRPPPPNTDIIKKQNENDLVKVNKIQSREDQAIINDGSMYEQLRRQLDAMRIHLGNIILKYFLLQFLVAIL